MVSVIIPNYNYARFLERRIGSVLAQTYRHFEIILLDDGSTDGSQALLRDYASEHGLKLICNETNGGSVFKQWNKGAKLATGEYVWIAEADDYADPHFLERVVSRLESNPKAGLAYCQSHRVDEKGELQGTLAYWTEDIDPARWNADYDNAGSDECARYLVLKNTIPNASAAVFRRSVFEQAGAAEEGMRLCGDWITWVRLLQRSDVSFVAQPLNFCRIHSQTVRTATPHRVYFLEQAQVRQEIRAHFAVPEEVWARALRDSKDNWKLALQRGRRELSWKWFRQAHATMNFGDSVAAMFVSFCLAWARGRATSYLRAGLACLPGGMVAGGRV